MKSSQSRGQKEKAPNALKGDHHLYVPPAPLRSVLRFHAFLVGLGGASPHSDSHRVCEFQMRMEKGLVPLWSLCPLNIPACGILGPEDSEVETGDNEGRVREGGSEGSPPDGSPTPGAGMPGGKGEAQGAVLGQRQKEQATSKGEGGTWSQRCPPHTK